MRWWIRGALALVLACGPGDEPACRVHDDCDVGMRCVDGRCAAAVDAGEVDAGTDPPLPRDGGPVDSGPGEPTPRFDLDRDGEPESDISVDACPGGACVVVTGALVTGSFPLGVDSLPTTAAPFLARPVRPIGDHVGGALQEVAVTHARAGESIDRPALTIVDVEAGAIVATAASPSTLTAFAQYPLAALSDVVHGPDGRLHPYLAPSYGDSADAEWGWLCIFHPGASGSSRCGEGFVEASAAPPSPGWFREVGAFTQDADGDGWEDIHLIFHQQIHTVSGRDGSALTTTVFDVAAADEPGSPAWFHSGRNYGTHAATTAPDGRLLDVIVGGAPVGAFGDVNCNVSRFLAVLSAPAGDPAARGLAWADYFGFASSIFREYRPAYEADPAADLARMGDFADGCIHRFSDSRTTIDGERALLVNYFTADAPLDPCLEEQYQLYLPPTWTAEKAEAWSACFARNAGTLGTWGMQARRESDGASVTGGLSVYVWGWTDRLLPGGEIVYLVEPLPERVRFDFADVEPSALRVYALEDGLFSARGSLPVVGRPRLRNVAGEGPRATGAWAGFAELATRDAGELVDIEMSDGTWVGWDGAAFAVR